MCYAVEGGSVNGPVQCVLVCLQELSEPTKEEKAVAKYLRFNCPTKSTTMVCHRVDYFVGQFALFSSLSLAFSRSITPSSPILVTYCCDGSCGCVIPLTRLFFFNLPWLWHMSTASAVYFSLIRATTGDETFVLKVSPCIKRVSRPAISVLLLTQCCCVIGWRAPPHVRDVSVTSFMIKQGKIPDG